MVIVMYVIIAYDVEAKRNKHVINLLRQYLFHTQNSLFEGELTNHQYLELKEKLEKKIDHDSDRIVIYKLPNDKYLNKDNIGIQEEMKLIL